MITPGLIEIPTKGWGAIEKCIYEYKTRLENKGHVVDILYANQVKKGEYDIVHSHVWNLSEYLSDAGIDNIFSLHDHHVEFSDACLQNNLKAISKCNKLIVHAKDYVDFFIDKGVDNVMYLSHGVDTIKYRLVKRDISNGFKILCVANNGTSGDSSYDRKGFRYVIESAIKLNMEVTIAGPLNNKNFFDANIDLLKYNKLNIVYDPSDDDVIELYKNHHIFINPSEWEAGKPNLTLLESISTGMACIATYPCNCLPGLYLCKRNVDSIVEQIHVIMKNWGTKAEIRKINGLRVNYDWEVIVSRLEDFYKKHISKMRNSLIDVYESNFDTNITSISKFYATYSFVKNPRIDIISGNGIYNVKFISDNGDIIYDTIIGSGSFAQCNIQYYHKWRIEVYENGILIDKHVCDVSGKKVYISLDSTALGDNISWIPYVEEFRKYHNCEVVCSTFWNDLFDDSYENIEFVKPGTSVDNIYALYTIKYEWGDYNINPIDVRVTPLQKVCSDQLGLEYKEIKPFINIDNKERTISDKYVCITTEASSAAKLWNREGGWQSIVNYLNNIGYKVVLIPKTKNFVSLDNVIDLSGNIDIQERVTTLYHCDFFIGLGSGLSWLAWALNKPVIMISGFSQPMCEFTNKYRIINTSVCHGCFNDINEKFDRSWNWCPRKQDPNKFECTKEISENMVISMINQLISDNDGLISEVDFNISSDKDKIFIKLNKPMVSNIVLRFDYYNEMYRNTVYKIDMILDNIWVIPFENYQSGMNNIILSVFVDNNLLFERNI